MVGIMVGWRSHGMEQLVSRYAIGIYRGYALTHYKPSTGHT